MDQVWEHSRNLCDTLLGISKILKKDGRLILSIPNSNGWGVRFFGKKWINWHIPYHLQHFSKRSIELSVEKSGLKIETIITITSSEWLYYQWLHLVTYPNKEGEKSYFWSSTVNKNISLSKKILLKGLSIIHKLKINHFITRLFDFIGMGDNYLTIMRKK